MLGRELLPILREPKQETSKEVIPPERQTLPAITPPPNYPNMPNLPPPYKPPKTSGGGGGGSGGGGGDVSTPPVDIYDIITPPETPFSKYFPPVVPPLPYQPTTYYGDKPPYTRAGGGGSYGGYSYVEPSTGKGYEVSETGVVKEIIPVSSPAYIPVYGGENKAELLGFRQGSTFIPAEAALTPEGLYKPEQVYIQEVRGSDIWKDKIKTGKKAKVTVYKTPRGYLQETETGEGQYEWKVGTGAYGTTGAKISETWKGEMIPGAETEATLSGELPAPPISLFEKQIAMIGGIPESEVFGWPRA